MCTCISIFLYIWYVERREDEQVLLLLLQNTYFRTLPRCVKTLDDFLRSGPLHPYPLGSNFLAFLHPSIPQLLYLYVYCFPPPFSAYPLQSFELVRYYLNPRGEAGRRNMTTDRRYTDGCLTPVVLTVRM